MGETGCGRGLLCRHGVHARRLLALIGGPKRAAKRCSCRFRDGWLTGHESPGRTTGGIIGACDRDVGGAGWPGNRVAFIPRWVGLEAGPAVTMVRS
jgi:hypothetical protein